LGVRWTTPFFSVSPYQFWPPATATVGVPLTRRIARTFLSRTQGVHSVRVQGADRVRESLSAGRSVLIACNSNKYADPVVLAAVSGLVLPPFHYMAARGDFEGNFSANGLLMQAAGAFSVDHSYNDLAAIRTAVGLLAGTGRRPLVLFPESLPYFNRDRIAPLFPGTAFIARAAARARAGRGLPAPAIHCAAVRYFYRSGLNERLDEHLAHLEQRAEVHPPPDAPTMEQRLVRLGGRLLDRLQAPPADAGDVDFAGRLAGALEDLFVRLERALALDADSRHPLARARRIHREIAARLLDPAAPAERKRHARALLAELDLIPRLARHGFAAASTAACTLERCAETVERLLDDVCGQWLVAAPTDVVVRFGGRLNVDPSAGKAARDPAAEQEFADRLRAAMQRELDALNGQDRPRGTRLM
jgi:1-acyl-sn-glycerol-3-phosphate acyltransferase